MGSEPLHSLCSLSLLMASSPGQASCFLVALRFTDPRPLCAGTTAGKLSSTHSHQAVRLPFVPSTWSPQGHVLQRGPTCPHCGLTTPQHSCVHGSSSVTRHHVGRLQQQKSRPPRPEAGVHAPGLGRLAPPEASLLGVWTAAFSFCPPLAVPVGVPVPIVSLQRHQPCCIRAQGPHFTFAASLKALGPHKITP